jgi:N-glycosylase/DNA lyase
MTIRLSPPDPFNLDFTLCCGQVFRWDKQSEWWYGVAGERVFKIRQTHNRLEFENADADFIKHYFGLHDDLPKIFSRIKKDKHIETAVNEFAGLRILRQDPWECLISYICATYKSIAAIKQMLLSLSKKLGKRVWLEGCDFYAFPTPAALAKATANELADCGLGYRVKYVSETAKMVCENGFEFEHLKNIGYEEAKGELLNFPGVGPKVADCVLLFSLEKLEAFPVDVWIRRVLLKHYAAHFPSKFVNKISSEKSLSNSDYRKLSFFGREYFGQYAGYAQEYLYHYERVQHLSCRFVNREDSSCGTE